MDHQVPIRDQDGTVATAAKVGIAAVVADVAPEAVDYTATPQANLRLITQTAKMKRKIRVVVVAGSSEKKRSEGNELETSLHHPRKWQSSMRKKRQPASAPTKSPNWYPQTCDSGNLSHTRHSVSATSVQSWDLA